MSRRNNNVQGPTSALTEFLKEHGITSTLIARRAATRQTQDEAAPAPAPAPAAGPSNAPAAAEASSSSRRRRRTTRASGYASDELDEPEKEDEEEEATPAKKRKLSKATEAKLKAKEKKKRGVKDSDDDYEDDDAYTAPSRALGPKPPVGSFEKCATCNKQFTVTKYTMAANSGTGYLCHQCAKAGGQDPFKKPAIPKRRPTEKRNITTFEERRFPTLVSLCIQLITKHIDDVEALGDIGAMNVEAISKALSKNRGLTPQNAHLFYNPTNASLTLFDATNLPSPALETLAYHNANLVSLRLDFCGHLDDKAFRVFSTGLPSLTRLELLGPFLVRSLAWQAFFKSHPKLEGFLVTQSPRFDEACIKALVKNCRKVTDLRLKEVGKMSDVFLSEIKGLKLRYLDLADPTSSCSEKAMIALLRAVGKTVTHLDVSKHDLLTDGFLTKGLQAHAKKLDSLVLGHLPELTDEGVGAFFEGWKGNPPLLSLDMSRNDALAGAALKGAFKHSGRRLEVLNINGWKDVPEDDLMIIGHAGPELRKVDVGWCRAVDDFVVKAWLEGEELRGVVQGGCSRLEELKVWGCNRVTAACPRRKGLVIFGIESQASV